jgi:hypothetical protein
VKYPRQRFNSLQLAAVATEIQTANKIEIFGVLWFVATRQTIAAWARKRAVSTPPISYPVKAATKCPGNRLVPPQLRSSQLASIPRRGLRHSHPVLLFAAQLRHNSFSLQVHEIFSRRKQRETSHPSLGFCQPVHRRDPQRVSISASLEYIESIVHRRYLALPKSIPHQEPHFRHP